MRISSFGISNYKSFLDSGPLSLAAGFNVVVGQNNVGKTAFLEALSLQFTGKPHKSLRSLPRVTTPINPVSVSVVTLILTGDELKEILLNTREVFWVPAPVDFSDFRPEQCLQFLESLFRLSEISFELRQVASINSSPSWDVARVPTHRIYDWNPNNRQFMGFVASSDRGHFTFQGVGSRQDNEDFGRLVAEALRQRIYIFRAERLSLAEAPHGTNVNLNSDAQNLAEVLNVLQSTNPNRFNKFNRLVSEIFPSIYRIAIKPHKSGGARLEIVVWTEDPATERDDLAIELSESGTGVGQALAGC